MQYCFIRLKTEENMTIEKFACVAEAAAKYYNLGYITRAYDEQCRWMVNETTQRQVVITKLGLLDVKATESALA
jgi:hypothetical protein